MSVQMALPFPEWRDIPGFNGMYQASNTGLVRRVKIVKGVITYRAMKSCTNKGYMVITLYTDRPNLYKVHRLVMAAFMGKSELQVNHKDGNKRNNNLSNLEYCTPHENTLHMWRTLGRVSQKGEEHSGVKLKESDVVEILRLRKKGMICREIAPMFNVTDDCISDISRGVTWKHIKREGQ